MPRQALALAILVAAAPAPRPALAQLPPGVYAGERDYRAAAAGTYAIDPAHTAVIAKVSHIGYGLSVFRFDKVEGRLIWDPAEPSRSTLTARVHTVSISSPVPGFAAELTGKGYLRSDEFPDATFVSSAFRQIDAHHGQVDGQFTLLGKTRPLTFDVVLQGAGKGFMGHPRLGLSATAHMRGQDFGLSSMFSQPMLIEIDAEFEAGA